MSNMSGLRRSRPEDQDESLKRLQEISVARMEGDESQVQCITPIERLSASSCDSKNIEDSHGGLVSESSKTQACSNPVLFQTNDTTAVDTNDKCQCRSTPREKAQGTEEMKPGPNATEGKASPVQHPQLVVNSCDEQLRTLSALSSPNKITSTSFSPTLPRLIPPLSPSFRCMSNSSLESAVSQKSAGCGSSSPSSPSRKYFKLLPPPAVLSAGTRRGSEPILDSISGTSSHQTQRIVADKRWNKLRSMLETMKNEPFDVDELIKTSPCDSPTLLSEKVDCYSQIFSLQTELAAFQNELHQKDLMHTQLLKERNAALAYIRLLRLNNPSQKTEEISSKDSIPQEKVYLGIDNLNDQSVSKGEVLGFLVEVVDELKKERNYLNQLMAVVLHRAPWMLEEVDRSFNQDLTSHKRMSERRDFEDDTTSTEDEVWC